MTRSTGWLPDNKAIYSYSMPTNLGAHSQRSLNFFRSKSRTRAILLVLPAVLEFPYLLFLLWTRGRPRRYLFVNGIALSLIGTTSGSETIVLGSLNELPAALRKRALWIPVSALYIALAWSRWTTDGELTWASRMMLRLLDGVLASRTSVDGWLILHSDALPLARGLISIARHLEIRACCIQHGMFHEQQQVPEIDGSQSDLNVVRSAVDARIIQRSNPSSTMLIAAELFRPPRPRTLPAHLRVSLIGEAWHTCDDAFDKLHRRKLRDLEAALIDQHIAVSFRPHPSERYRALFYGFRRLDFGNKRRAFEQFNVFIGYASTLLNEAAAAGHLAIQLIHPQHATPTIVRDGGPEIPRVQTPDELVALLAQGGSRHTEVGSTLESDKASAVARVIAALQNSDRLPIRS